MVKNNMKNLIREELFKTQKSKTLYICLALAVVGLIFVAFLYNDTFYDYHWLDLQAEIPWTLNFSTFIVVFVLVYICGEFSQGTIKNYIAIGFSRTKVYLSKLIKIAMITFGLVFLLQVIALTFTPFIFGGTVVDIKVNLIYYFYGLFALLEALCFYVAIAFITKSIGAVLGVYFGLSALSGILTTLSIFINDSAFFDFLFDMLQYSYFDMQITLAQNLANGLVTSPTEIVLSIMVPLIVMGVSTFGAILLFNKQDVK